jgi:hypothetical protein
VGDFVLLSYDFISDILYHSALDQDKQLVKTDSFKAQLALNTSNKWAPETPHAIRNMGKDSLVLYRVDFKQ